MKLKCLSDETNARLDWSTALALSFYFCLVLALAESELMTFCMSFDVVYENSIQFAFTVGRTD